MSGPLGFYYTSRSVIGMMHCFESAIPVSDGKIVYTTWGAIIWGIRSNMCYFRHSTAMIRIRFSSLFRLSCMYKRNSYVSVFFNHMFKIMHFLVSKSYFASTQGICADNLPILHNHIIYQILKVLHIFSIFDLNLYLKFSILHTHHVFIISA